MHLHDSIIIVVIMKKYTIMIMYAVVSRIIPSVLRTASSDLIILYISMNSCGKLRLNMQIFIKYSTT